MNEEEEMLSSLGRKVLRRNARAELSRNPNIDLPQYSVTEDQFGEFKVRIETWCGWAEGTGATATIAWSHVADALLALAHYNRMAAGGQPC